MRLFVSELQMSGKETDDKLDIINQIGQPAFSAQFRYHRSLMQQMIEQFWIMGKVVKQTGVYYLQ